MIAAQYQMTRNINPDTTAPALKNGIRKLLVLGSLARIFQSQGRARCPQRAGTGLRRAGLLYAKVCANREDFRDATGARTFLSAATPECSTGAKRSRSLLPFNVAADKNVRAPLWFRLGRPGDRRALPAATDRLSLLNFSSLYEHPRLSPQLRHL